MWPYKLNKIILRSPLMSGKIKCAHERKKNALMSEKKLRS
jgi:hypothetical protein